MTHSEHESSAQGLFVILVIIIAVIVAFQISNKPQSSTTQKYTQCAADANKLHDSERKTITENINGYDTAEQQVYYQRTDDAYTNNLANCQDWYNQ